MYTSVVKISCIRSEPNFKLPWQNQSLQESSGSGFVIEGRRILTNAHVVVHSKFIHISRYGSPTRYVGRLVAISHESDLALITVDEGKECHFFDDTPSFSLMNTLPALETSVIVVGYPKGGDNLSVTRGVVSRIDYDTYTQSNTKLLVIQIDAAINSGNSGGPVLIDNQVVGVAFQSLSGADNIGYIIPVERIEHFLIDVARNFYAGPIVYQSQCICSLGCRFMTMQNPDLQQFKGLTRDQTGVLVIEVDPWGPSHTFLKTGDVLLTIDKHPVDHYGEVYFNQYQQLPLDWLVTKKHKGDIVHLTVWRDHKEVALSFPLWKCSPLVDYQFQDPSYFVFAGFVFQPLTISFLMEWSETRWEQYAPRTLVDKALSDKKKSIDHQLVIISLLLNHRINVGYEHTEYQIVSTVNGIPIRNLMHLYTEIQKVTTDTSDTSDTTDTTTMGHDDSSIDSSINSVITSVTPSKPNVVVLETDDHHVIVIDIQKAIAARQDIQDVYRINRDVHLTHL